MTVLFVCTGNVCRSPLMERLLIAQLGPSGDGITVHSAGTGALVGRPMADETAAEVIRLGADPAGFAARQLTADLVSEADLVVTATRSHRAAVVTLVPRATQYTFTLGELARLLAPLGALALPSDTRVAGLAAAAASNRGLTPPVAPGADDIPDPYRRTAADYRRASDLMVPAVADLAAALRD